MACLIFNDRPTSLPCTLAPGRPILALFSYGRGSPIKASQRECTELISLVLREAGSFLWRYDNKGRFSKIWEDRSYCGECAEVKVLVKRLCYYEGTSFHLYSTQPKVLSSFSTLGMEANECTLGQF